MNPKLCVCFGVCVGPYVVRVVLSGGLEVDYVSIFVYYGSTKVRLGESLVFMWTVCSRIGICTLPLAQSASFLRNYFWAGLNKKNRFGSVESQFALLCMIGSSFGVGKEKSRVRVVTCVH